MSITKDIDGFSKEIGFTKFSQGADNFIIDEMHEDRQTRYDKCKAGDRTAQREWATKYNVISIVENGKKIV